MMRSEASFATASWIAGSDASGATVATHVSVSITTRFIQTAGTANAKSSEATSAMTIAQAVRLLCFDAPADFNSAFSAFSRSTSACRSLESTAPAAGSTALSFIVSPSLHLPNKRMGTTFPKEGISTQLKRGFPTCGS